MYLLLVLIFSAFNQYAQNIVANSDFSDVNTCAEQNARCAPEAWLLASPNLPVHKNGVVGITVLNTGKSNVRQYLETELLMEMEDGKEYEVSILLRADECVINTIGVKFQNDFVCLGDDDLIQEPDIDFESQLNSIGKRKQRKWMELNFTYKARGGERFILIGCFSSDKEQQRDFKKDPLPFKNYYYFFDQVEVKPKHIDTLSTESESVKKHLYSFDYRHSMCSYKAYQKPKEIISDSIEVVERTPRVERIVLGDVLFDFNSSSLKPEATDEILSKMSIIDTDTLSKIEIYGYTDNVGNDEYNNKLSKDRADAVKQLLIENGFKAEIINSNGMGSEKPIADNRTEEGRSKNRRIEILFE